MCGYVITKTGIFGTIIREYKSESGVDCIVIRWGPLGWVTPIRKDEVHQLKSRYEHLARKEAIKWLEEQEE